MPKFTQGPLIISCSTNVVNTQGHCIASCGGRSTNGEDAVALHEENCANAQLFTEAEWVEGKGSHQ